MWTKFEELQVGDRISGWGNDNGAHFPCIWELGCEVIERLSCGCVTVEFMQANGLIGRQKLNPNHEYYVVSIREDELDEEDLIDTEEDGSYCEPADSLPRTIQPCWQGAFNYLVIVRVHPSAPRSNQ